MHLNSNQQNIHAIHIHPQIFFYDEKSKIN